jgi:hypothetical protein
MEWVIVENIRNLDVINVNGQTRLKLRDHFRKIHREEKKARDNVEKAQKTNPEYNGLTFKMMEKREEIAEDAH